MKNKVISLTLSEKKGHIKMAFGHRRVIRKLRILRMIAFIFLFLSVGVLSGQQLTPYVVSSSGGFYTSASGMLSFTTGEMAAVETYTSAPNILTQGFQQSWDFGTGLAEIPNLKFSFSLYPNPSDGKFNLVAETESNERVIVKIIDLLGREIWQSVFDLENKVNRYPIDLSAAAPGLYTISLTVREDHELNLRQQYIGKIQIIR